MELSRSLLSGWVDACCRLLSPLDEALQGYVLTDGKLHANDTPVPVLLPGNKKTKTGLLWTYVRDDRNAGSALAPAVWFAFSSDRKGIHPQTHLAGFSGVLQADAYAGFNELYRNGRIPLLGAGLLCIGALSYGLFVHRQINDLSFHSRLAGPIGIVELEGTFARLTPVALMIALAITVFFYGVCLFAKRAPYVNFSHHISTGKSGDSTPRSTH